MTETPHQAERACTVPACLAEQFPHFDLSVLSEKQLAVVEMRLCGGLSFRKIAAFEGVTHQAVMCRFVSALELLAVAQACRLALG